LLVKGRIKSLDNEYDPRVSLDIKTVKRQK